MSASSAWAYTATATLWPWLGRDDWTGKETFGPPETFACGYAAKSERRTDALGVEFISSQTIYTEKAGIKQKDRVLIGSSSIADPIAAGAAEVRAVRRDQDVFDGAADDYQIFT